MRIDETKGVIVFERLVSADRSLGSDETITMPKAAEKAVAANAKGVFARKTLTEIHASAKAASVGLSKALLDC